MKTLRFQKMQASGNDFILLDNRAHKFSTAWLKNFARAYCDRKFGVGADGVLAIEQSKHADFKMRIINADGSEAEMCGNGSRCVALWASKANVTFETLAGIIYGQISKGNVRVKMSHPFDLKLDIPLHICVRDIRVNFINTGVPHAVVFVEGLAKIDVDELGRKIRNHAEFAPAGTNVDFVEIIGEDKIALRTYERGVEAETLACGTGTVASSIIYNFKMHNISSPQKQQVSARTQSSEILKVHFDRHGARLDNVWLEGKAHLVFTGEITL